MPFIKISQKEADRLLHMLKRSLVSEITFPLKGESAEFDVIGDKRQDLFTIKIFRGRINHLKYNLGARITRNGILLLELHINPSNVHFNPDGNKIVGNHWHIYSEEFGRLLTLPAGDIECEQFTDNTIIFLEKFHVIEKPVIHQKS